MPTKKQNKKQTNEPKSLKGGKVGSSHYGRQQQWQMPTFRSRHLALLVPDLSIVEDKTFSTYLF